MKARRCEGIESTCTRTSNLEEKTFKFRRESVDDVDVTKIQETRVVRDCGDA